MPLFLEPSFNHTPVVLLQTEPRLLRFLATRSRFPGRAIVAGYLKYLLNIDLSLI